MAADEPTTTDFDPSQTGANYNTLLESWELCRDFAEMHLSILRDGTYLDKFGHNEATGEATAPYAWRKQASLAMDHCADLIGLRVDNIFRTPPVRKYEDSPHEAFINEFLRDVDGGGTGMTEFMRRHLPQYYALGVDFVVDKEAPKDATPATLAQERELGLLPYVHAFTPLERVDWACDHAGKYLWARYDLGLVPAADEQEDAAGSHLYLTMMPNMWRLYTVNSDDDSPTTVQTGTHALGQCPVVSFYFKTSMRSDYPQVPISLLTRIAPIARYLLNLVSEIEVDIHRNVAFLVATGVEADKIPTEITPMSCWALPDGAEIQDVSGAVGHITAKVAFAQTLMETILRIGKLTGATGDLKTRAASGVQVAVERTDLDNEMRMTAAQAEQVETDLVWMAVCRHTGKRIGKDELGFTVQYNTKYVLTAVGELIAQAKEFVGLGVEGEVPTMLRILLRKVLDATANEDAQEYVNALAELEAAVFDSLAGPLPAFGEDAEGDEEAEAPTEDPSGDELELDEDEL